MTLTAALQTSMPEQFQAITHTPNLGELSNAKQLAGSTCSVLGGGLLGWLVGLAMSLVFVGAAIWLLGASVAMCCYQDCFFVVAVI